MRGRQASFVFSSGLKGGSFSNELFPEHELKFDLGT